MRKKVLVLFCAGLLMVGLLLLPASASTGLSFLAINDTLVSQSAQTTPIQSSGWVYVPANIFSSRVTGINLGVYSGLSENNTSLTLYNLSGKTIVFDLTSGTASATGSSPPVPSRVVKQNGIYYVPAYTVCQYFGLTYSYLSTDYGPLLRIKDGGAVLSDARFVSSVSSMLKSRLASAQQQEPVPSKPTVPTSPAKPSAPSASAKPVAPSAKPTPAPEKKAPVFSLTLGLRASPDGDLPGLLNILSQHRIRAVVFVPANQVNACADALRQAVGQGHRLGLIPVGDSPEARLKSVREGETAVARLLRQEVWFVLRADSVITDAGYLNWSPDLTLAPPTNADALYAAITEEGADHASALRVLAGDTLSASPLSDALTRLSGNGDTFLSPRETLY